MQTYAADKYFWFMIGSYISELLYIAVIY